MSGGRARRAAQTGRRIAADVVALNHRAFAVRFAVRCTIGVTLALLVGTMIGGQLSAVSAAYGALVAGLASRQGIYRTRLAVMTITGCVLALGGFLGATTGGSIVANIVLGTAWAAGAGVLAAAGRAGIVVSVNAIVAFLVFSGTPFDQSVPLVQAAMLLGGALLQAVLLVLIWPLQRYTAERTALASAYRDLAAYADGLEEHDLGLPSAEPLAVVRRALNDPQPFGGRAELAALEALADEVDRIRATLAALNTDLHLLEDVGLTARAAAIRALSHAAAPVLRELSDALLANREPQLGAELWQRLNDARVPLEAVPDAASSSDARAFAGLLRAAVRTARAAVNGGLPIAPPRSPGNPLGAEPLHEAWATLRANVSLDSIYARHSLRVAATVAIAIVLAHRLPLQHAQWIGLTVALVLRPDFSQTFARGLARIGGTVGGAIAAALVALMHPAAPVYGALSVACAGLGFALFSVSYALYSAAITGYVMFLLAFGGSAEGPTAFDRVVATVVGGALSLAAYAAWPTWTRSQVGALLADLFEAQRAYASLVLHGTLEGTYDHAARARVHDAVFLARSNAEAAVDQLAGEPVRSHELRPAAARRLLTASRRFGIASLTLAARLDRAAHVPQAELRRFADDTDAALGMLAAALRARTPLAAFPALRDDQEALARALSAEGEQRDALLVSETELMVDALESSAAIITHFLVRASR